MTQLRQDPTDRQPASLPQHPKARTTAPAASRFQRETQLAHVFEKSFSTERSRWAWLSELESPNGIADLAAIRVSDTRRCREQLALIPPKWAYALRCLPMATPVTALEFAGSLNVTPAYARTILGRFKESGFCTFEKYRRSWTKIIQPEPIADKIVAIELKLSDWKRALYQASRYLDFATQSWVVLDECALDRARAHVEMFGNRGIGLAGITPQGDLQVECQAANRVPRLPGRFWHMNAEISRRLTESRLQMPAVEPVHAVEPNL
jgi:hypothetical protein